MIPDSVAQYLNDNRDRHLESLKEYGERGKRQHDVIVHRFFGGLQWKEIATILGIAVTTSEKDWQAARAWLKARLEQGDKT